MILRFEIENEYKSGRGSQLANDSVGVHRARTLGDRLWIRASTFSALTKTRRAPGILIFLSVPDSHQAAKVGLLIWNIS